MNDTAYHQSYTEFSTAKLAELATAALAGIDRARAECASRYLAKTLEEMRKSWWGRFSRFVLRRPLPTADELAARYESLRGVYVRPYHFIKLYWSDEEETARRLFNLSLRAESNTVFVTAADLAHVGLPFGRK